MWNWWQSWWRMILCFIRRYLFAQPEQSFNMAECIYGWSARYRVEEQGCTVRVIVRIRLDRDADVTQEQLNAAQATWEQSIEQEWSNRFTLSRTNGNCSCVTYSATFDVQFVASGEHHIVRVRAGSGRANMTTWFLTSSGGTAAHEFGHMLGFPDEYADEACPDRVVATDNSIMRTTSGDPMVRHYQPFATWASHRTCCTYSVM